MDVRSQTSFIPKRAVISTGSTVSRSTISIFLLIAIIIFIVAIGLSAGVFFYQRALVERVSGMNKRLVASKGAFETTFINEVVKLSKRIEASKEILDRHLVLSPLFELLEAQTLAGVRFTGFTYAVSGPNDISLSLKGEARSFNAVALQSDVFGEEPLFKNPIFSDLNLDEQGNVIFRFKTSVDPKFLLYRNTLEEEAQ